LLALALALSLFSAAQTGDLAGDWDLTILSPNGTHKASIAVKRDGDHLAGILTAPRAANIPVEITAKDDQVKFVFTVRYHDEDMRVTLAGAVKDDGLQGSADFGGQGQGSWKGVRAGLAGLSPAIQEKVDVSGPWSFQVETSIGSGRPSFTFKQDGERLSGNYKGAFGEAPVSGSIRGNDLTFSVRVTVDGSEGTIVYKGNVEKDGSMKGTVALGDSVSGTWTAKRVKTN